jgi:hypothetical protein
MPTRPLLALTVALMFALATPASASADCRPAPPIDQALRAAPVAFVGTVVAVEGPSARFAVTEVWAGDVGPTVEVRGLADLGGRDGGFGPGFSEDDRHWTEGTAYLVLPTVDGGVLRDHLCTATTDWRDELAALRPANAVIVEPAASEGDAPVAVLALAALGVAAVLVGAVAFRRR